MIKNSKTREDLIKMYIDSLKQEKIPWRQCWKSELPRNGISNIEYKGINRLILSFVASRRNYEDPRWFTYNQLREKGYKLKNGKGQGVPIEFWSVYNTKTKERFDLLEYEKIIIENPEKKQNFKLICKNYFVFNGSIIEGLPKIKNSKKTFKPSKFIEAIFSNLGVTYLEEGDRAFYRPLTDTIVLPTREKFDDEYSYYATQLHEICHATGHRSRLNRVQSLDSIEYAKEELIAEISASFLMQEINLNKKAEHYDSHIAYVKNWISILENQPYELFKAINESTKVCDYIKEICLMKSKIANKER